MKKILIVATSLDGYIAQSKEQIATAWTSEEDRKWFNKISKEIGVMIMGRQTYETIGFPLPGRKTVVMTRDKSFEAEKIENFQVDSEKKLYKTGEKTPEEIMAILADKGLVEVAICGGARVYEAFLRAKMVDELYLTVEAVFLGKGIKLLEVNENEVFEPLKLKILDKIELSKQTTVYHLEI